MSSGKNSPKKVRTSSEEPPEEEDWYTKPEFIYGGPFIPVAKPTPFINTTNPLNVELQGTFTQSFAYYSLKERLPTILTKIIDYLSREGGKIKKENSASDDDIKSFMQAITKLKSDLMTNKEYDLFTLDTPEAQNWNTWIFNCDHKKYFFNTWVFSECYVYRKLKEACELTKTLQNFDYFEEQKKLTLDSSIEFMCIVADRLVRMLPKSEVDQLKADFVLLLKLSLWSNKCDLSLSMGEPVKAGEATETQNCVYQNPFQMIIDFKDKILVDDTKKISDQVLKKAEAMATKVKGQTTPPKPPPPLRGKAAAAAAAAAAAEAAAALERGEVPEEKPPVIPCPAKFAVPTAVYFDIVCDNAGYELFTDMCLAHFLVSQGIVEKVRFHVKKMPWFVSDATPKDIEILIDTCKKSEFKKDAPPPPPEPTEPQPEVKKKGKPVELAEPIGDITSENLKNIANQWSQLIEDGVFVILNEDYWTYPHVYKDMKKYDPNMYRKLQTATAIVFKGDLNYRKLVGERCCSPSTKFEANLQGFVPAPIIAIRTVKAETVCGVNKKKYDLATKANPKWMQTGDYGLIQYCKKGEALKPSAVPCMHYGDTCHSMGCPPPHNI